MSFHSWNTDWAITCGMRCSVMFICVKTSSTEEGMIAFTRAPLCTSLQRVTAPTREPELIAATRVNACVGFIPARFWTVPEAALQGVYTAICHAKKDGQNAIYYLNLLKKIKEINTVFVRYTCVLNRKTVSVRIRVPLYPQYPLKCLYDILYDIPCYRDEHALKFEQLCQTSSANVVYMWNGSILSHVSNKLLCVRCAAVIRFCLNHLAHSNPNMISDHNYICVIFHSYFVQNSNPY